jgi:ribonuclease HII
MLSKHSSHNEIGIDEAGRGPLIGRVYAGAVIWGDNIVLDEKIKIVDSKKLSAKKRKIALEWIKNNVSAWGVGYSEPEEIDSINILKATKLAMVRAIDNLKSKIDFNPTELLIDGIGWGNMFYDSEYTVNSVIKGDELYYSISAASIIAKEYHDEYIKDLCSKNPELDTMYSLSKNMGYGTKKHIDGIYKYGITKYHRKSFKPCSSFVD